MCDFCCNFVAKIGNRCANNQNNHIFYETHDDLGGRIDAIRLWRC